MGLMTADDPRDIPKRLASCSVYRAGGRVMNRSTFEVVVFMCEMSEHLSAHGKW